MNRLSRLSPSTVSCIAALLLLGGGFFLSYSYLQAKKVYAFTYMNERFFDVQSVVLEEEQTLATAQEVIPTTYIGMLKISKLGIERGFLDKRATGNNIEENITVLKESDYPDVPQGNLILAAHSGPTAISFFNELYQLSLGDTAEVTYKDKTYTYQLVYTYQVPKTGTIEIKRDKKKTTLTLITCTNDNRMTQTVYILERV